ncbi:MAG: quinolinate synthase NadA [Desulfobacteraceae bacterium]|nr:quinolinate synthase NadA [Desulfobacteraceae bacterium]
MQQLLDNIQMAKRRRNAVILAHVYQRGEVQDIADFTGDSLELSRKAMDTEADLIVFCGVKFMAETAAILNPTKTVLIPEYAGCALADMATQERLRAKKQKHPKATVVSYVNSSAVVKSESDVCCTSANAVDIVKSLAEEEILFLPDKNLGTYVASQTDKDIILWNGYCYVHEENITTTKIAELRRQHPEAEVIVHPECNLEVIQLADYVGSTSQMLKYTGNSQTKEFIVGTEDGLIHRLSKENPDKNFYSLHTFCHDMKLITLESILLSLNEMKYRVKVPEQIRVKAKIAIDRMFK